MRALSLAVLALGLFAGAAAASAQNFQGLWDSNYGRIRLAQTAQRVHGAYAYANGSSIDGTVKNGRFVFRYREPAAAGEGWFELAKDGRSFTGKWRADGAQTWENWSGKRVVPAPDRSWLVIIEANWEQSLTDHEYSFGQMVKSFFTRVPAVQVRHRFFSTAPELEHWLREVPYLAEPTVVVISGHGLEDGMLDSRQGNPIKPDVFTRTLRYADNVKLLHLAACLTLKGGYADQILRGLGRTTNFPISGYTTDVDWAGSAVSDLLYYQLLLEHQLAPKEAIRQLLLMMPLAGSRAQKGAVIPSLGMRLVQPQ
jgi:hypothetical protein